MLLKKILDFCPVLLNLILRHLLHPSAAAVASTNPVPEAHFFDQSRLPKEGFYPRRLSSYVTKNCNVDESNSPICFSASFRFSVMQFEAARKFVLGTSEDAGSKSGALADGDAYCHPEGRKASYDSDDSDDAHHRDSYDSDSHGGDSSDEDDCFNEGSSYSDNEDFEKGSDYSDDDDYEVKRRSNRYYFDREDPPSWSKKYL